MAMPDVESQRRDAQQGRELVRCVQPILNVHVRRGAFSLLRRTDSGSCIPAARCSSCIHRPTDSKHCRSDARNGHAMPIADQPSPPHRCASSSSSCRVGIFDRSNGAPLTSFMPVPGVHSRACASFTRVSFDGSVCARRMRRTVVSSRPALRASEAGVSPTSVIRSRSTCAARLRSSGVIPDITRTRRGGLRSPVLAAIRGATAC